jgi:hypothetical protein
VIDRLYGWRCACAGHVLTTTRPDDRPVRCTAKCMGTRYGEDCGCTDIEPLELDRRPLGG